MESLCLKENDNLYCAVVTLRVMWSSAIGQIGEGYWICVANICKLIQTRCSSGSHICNVLSVFRIMLELKKMEIMHEQVQEYLYHRLM